MENCSVTNSYCRVHCYIIDNDCGNGLCNGIIFSTSDQGIFLFLSNTEFILDLSIKISSKRFGGSFGGSGGVSVFARRVILDLWNKLVEYKAGHKVSAANGK